MKTVAGPTDRVVVIGAGLSGLAAALYLRGAGREVTLVERADHPGGRVGVYRGPDYEIDNGATVLTLPELITDALAAVGRTPESLANPLRIIQLAPSYHARFADGSDIRVFADPDAMAEEVTRTCGPEEAARYRRLRDWLARIYRAEFGEFMDTNFDSPLDMVRHPAKRAALRDLVRLGGFGRLGPRVERFLTDRRLSRLFTFQALYAGVAPADALAVYGAIPHMDTSLGVYFPEGGMRAVAAAMAEAFTGAGGELLLNTEVVGIEYEDRRARRVRTAGGAALACDAVVLTADLGSIERFGGRNRRGLRAAPSAVVAHGTVPAEVAAAWPVQAHHTIDFGAAWASTFAEIAARPRRGGRTTAHGRLMSDPSLLLTRPALTDPGLFIDRADGRHEPFSLLAPCPNLASAPLDWEPLARPYLRELLAVLEARGYTGIARHFTVDHLDTPATWRARGMIAGTPFSLAHLFRQTGPFRPRNLPGFSDNVVIAGCGTTPGVGVPTALLSGKLAANRVTGVDSRARREPPVPAG
ncbi:phytoene desaturase [Nocardia puris]|uniref:phytoene desaturase family protein n=1 Tax=Nocardia puris TaxID=208602 RepID=UPI0018952206|nr:phytoene desaturase family protein [Nocardia puris]MBF6212966.1 phytoene desaturase [Nocardia puris]MBF6367957.1 phytoene desaturase [Nocardia puris]MBF6462590.1 phytoene desaturase [Nocardia puris]